MSLIKKCVMSECEYYNEYGECSSVCSQFHIKPILTNHDRIINMTVDEMAKFMNECRHDFPPYCDHSKSGNCDKNCLNCAKQWLTQEINT